MIHLHVHSNFSFLDGASPPDRLLQRAPRPGYAALALTDHHGLYGVVRFIHAARAHGIKPIIGVEICLRTRRARRGASAERLISFCWRKTEWLRQSLPHRHQSPA